MTKAQRVLELDAEFMCKAFSLVDSQRELIADYVKDEFNAYGDTNLSDDWEFVHAMGFVVAQKYLTASCKVLGMEKEKREAFSVGPRVNADVTCAALVNAAANHFKHSDEWDFDKLSEVQRTTIDTIQKADIQVLQPGGSVASEVFEKLGLQKFEDLIPILQQWIADTEAAFPKGS